MKKIAVIYGGESVEHDISIITALQAMKNIKGYEFVPLYIKPNGEIVSADNLNDGKIYLNYDKLVKNEKKAFFLPSSGEIYFCKKSKIKEKFKPYCALLCNHGHGGEDGLLQGLLEMCKIPYSSSSVASSALTMDKVFTKIILEKFHITTPAYVHFDKFKYKHSYDEILKEVEVKVGFPCIIKPSSGGSSVGISICENALMFNQLTRNALEFDDKILVEKYIENAKEFSCGVVKSGNKLFSSKIWQVKKGKMFTFEEKYIQNEKEEHDEIGKKLEEKIKNLACSCYEVLEEAGVVRVDFLLDEKDGKLYVGEVNSIPGSLAFNLFKFPFSDLICCLVEEGVERMKGKGQINYSFSSTAIKNYLELGDKISKK